MIFPDPDQGMWVAASESPRPVISEYERHRHRMMSVNAWRHREGCYDWLEAVELEWRARTVGMTDDQKRILRDGWMGDYFICLSVMRSTCYFCFLTRDDLHLD